MSLDVGQLYAEHRRRVRGYLVSRTRDDALADELTQETFLRAYERRATYQPQPGAPVTAWLFRIADRLFIDYVRPTKRHTRTLSLDNAEIGVTTRHHEDVIDLRSALACLNDRQRRVIELRFFEGHTTAETAARIGNSEDGVKKLQARALVNLRNQLTGAPALTSRAAWRALESAA